MIDDTRTSVDSYPTTAIRRNSITTAGQICIRGICTAFMDESVCVVARRMKDSNVSSLVILNDAKTPIGIITDRDLTVRILAEHKAPERTTAGDLISEDLIAVDTETSLERALELMRSGPYRRLPVVDRKGELIGLLSIDDILEELANEFQCVG